MALDTPNSRARLERATRLAVASRPAIEVRCSSVGTSPQLLSAVGTWVWVMVVFFGVTLSVNPYDWLTVVGVVMFSSGAWMVLFRPERMSE